MQENRSDEEIIESFKSGEEADFKLLIDKYTPMLFNFLARLTDRENVTDIIQDTFIKVWKNLHKFDSSKASFKTWIFTVAKNTAFDFLRKKKSILFSDMEKDWQSEKEPIHFSEKIEDESLLPDEALQKIQDYDFLNSLLDELPPQYKIVLVLHYQEEMTFEEIGKVLDKSPNTVKSQHRRAILELRKKTLDAPK